MTAVVVTDAEERSVLGACRGLAAAGYSVCAVGHRPRSATHWSRSCAERVVLPDPRESVRRFVDGLEDLLGTGRYAVLIPGSDAALLAVSEHRDRLECLAELGLPSREAVQRSVDKRLLLESAAGACLAQPSSKVCDDLEEGEAAATQLGYPVVVKPAQSFQAVNGGLRQHSVALVADDEAFEQAARKLAPPFIVQHYERAPFVSCTGVFADGRLLALTTSRVQRLWPPEAGMHTFSETVQAPDGLAERVRELLVATGWQGIFQLQMLELADGRLSVIDLNPRVFASITLDDYAGANLAALWCDWLLGRNPLPVVARPAMRYRWEEGELCHFAWQLRHGRLRAAFSVALPRRRVTHSWFRVTDPGPLVARGLDLALRPRGKGMRTVPEAEARLEPHAQRERAAAPPVAPKKRVTGVVLGGRALLVWLPVYFLLAQTVPTAQAALAAAAVSVIWLLGIRAALGAYFTLGPTAAVATGTLIGLVAVSAFDLWIPDIDFGVERLTVAAVAVFALSAAWEHAVRSIAKRRVLVVGSSDCASEVLAELRRGDRAPFTMLGLVGEDGDAPAEGVPCLGSVDELPRIVEEHRPDIVILADERVTSWAMDPLLDIAPVGFRVVGVSHFIEHALGRVSLRHITPTWFMSMLHLRQKPYTRVTKRIFDLALSSLGLLLVAPLFTLLVLLVRTTPGPVIYRQTRLGEGGRRFTIFKLRTMRVDAERTGSPRFAEEHDSRATWIGGFLRRTHLDELPQLWNVLRGEMSVVGPRPERPEFVELLERTVPFWTRRLLVKPGITGWAQLRCGYASDSESMAEKLSYDLWYLRNRDVVVDLAICAKTVTALLFRSGR